MALKALSSLVLFSLLLVSPANAQSTPIPKGKLLRGTYVQSSIFPGTTRDYAVYIPAQYNPEQPANLMVFMDGMNYAKADGPFRVPDVLDRLIHAKEIPVTVAVFVNPGTILATLPDAAARSNRSFEYDSLGSRYASFLCDEFLPTVLDGLRVSDAPSKRAVCGISSGGICAFTVAWQHPEIFGNVISHIGSYTNIRGGWAYPALIRKTKDAPKQIKVYLQEGVDDLNNLHGNWPLANQDMAAALHYAGHNIRFELTAGGHSGKWAGEVLPDAIQWLWNPNSEPTTIAATGTKPAWTPHPEALVKANVPQGTVEVQQPWESEIFDDTIRNWAIYVPKQYDPSQPTALMVFQDGERMRDLGGRWRIPTVLDNLIASGHMPPTIAIFLDPGHDKSKPRQGNKSSNRSLEYDSLGDRYVRFLLEEIIPEVAKRYSLSDDPAQRAIGGSSSGAICAFTAAWERPDQFGKVYSSVGSFTNLRGGDIYPSLVRKTEPKPLRVYMADTSGDLDNPFGNWPLDNKELASALEYMGYDVRFDWAKGYGHNADFGGSRFPDAMKWLWRSEVHKPQIDTSDDLRGDLTLLNLLIPGESWETVARGIGFADAPCTDSAGNFYYSDMRAPAVYRIDAETGAQSVVAELSVSGLEFGPNGLLYGCQGAESRVITIDPATGDTTVVASNMQPNDLAITKDGIIFITETRKHQITAINIATDEVTIADTGILRPNGIALSNDGGTLVVSDSGGDAAWTFRVNANGALDAKMPTLPMRLAIDQDGEFRFNNPPPYVQASRGDGMAVDGIGRYYITSSIGVQVFDPTGRPCGVLPHPDASQSLTSCILAGANHSYLYITNGNTIYRRKLAVK